jgi:hypothetical protein
MGMKKILWLEDQTENFNAYQSTIFRSGILLDAVQSISDAEKKIREQNDNYSVLIFDIKVLPGKDPRWIACDDQKRKETPDFDSYLGLEFLNSLFQSPKARVIIYPPIRIDPKKVIVLSVVCDRKEEILSLGIPEYQILYKASCNPQNLLSMIKNIMEKK